MGNKKRIYKLYKGSRWWYIGIGNGCAPPQQQRTRLETGAIDGDGEESIECGENGIHVGAAGSHVEMPVAVPVGGGVTVPNVIRCHAESMLPSDGSR